MAFPRKVGEVALGDDPRLVQQSAPAVQLVQERGGRETGGPSACSRERRVVVMASHSSRAWPSSTVMPVHSTRSSRRSSARDEPRAAVSSALSKASSENWRSRPRRTRRAEGSGGFAGRGQRPWPARAGRTATVVFALLARQLRHRGRHGLDLPPHREHEHELAFVQHIHDLALGAHPEDARARDEEVGGHGVAAPGIEAAQGLHRLLDAHQPEPGRAQARGHAEPDEIDERVAPGRAVSVGARERRGQEPAAIPVVELARGEVGEAGGAGSREPGFEDVTLEFHACILHPRNRCRVPLVDGDRCKGETLAGS